MIPHPMISPCSRKLKIEIIEKYCFDNQIDVDLIGYVKNELKRRTKGQNKKTVGMFDTPKAYPIGDFSDDWCFEIVDRYIGWHPKIYDLLDDDGNRLFKHNNCLPCKNMQNSDIELVKKFYNPYYKKAMALSSQLGKFWGRDEAEFYTLFGRDLGQESTCEACKF